MNKLAKQELIKYAIKKHFKKQAIYSTPRLGQLNNSQRRFQ